jgi:hypothetical protein
MPKPKSAGHAARMMALFVSNTRSRGRYNQLTDRAYTEDEAITENEWTAHLSGHTGAGGVPILDDDTCLWGAIDCDNHDSDEDLPIKKVDEAIRTNRLPLVACRSKSGGIHAYAFFEKPQSAAKVRTLLAKWSGLIGYGGHEVFPKQAHLIIGRDGKKTKGNWINFPYFAAAKTNRYCYHDGKALSLDEFLTLAERSRITESQLRALSLSDHPDAPPCIQHLYQHGVAQGHRNEALYNIVVYHKKVDPATAEAKAQEANQTVFSKPLPRAELGRTVNSALRAEMQYRCNEEPIRSLCDRETCLKRKHGITPADAERLATTESIPSFANLVKYASEPVRWDMEVDTVKISNIGTEQLLDWRAIRTLIAERLTKVVPLIKNQEWERILQPMMKEARIVETPDDASISGVIRDRLREFAAKTDLTSAGQDTEDRKALLRGLPVVAVVDGDRCVVFRGQDFINYLKRTKSEELKGINLWLAVKNIGVFHNRMRPGKGATLSPIDVWCLPIKEVLAHLQPTPQKEFRSEI